MPKRLLELPEQMPRPVWMRTVDTFDQARPAASSHLYRCRHRRCGCKSGSEPAPASFYLRWLSFHRPPLSLHRTRFALQWLYQKCVKLRKAPDFPAQAARHRTLPGLTPPSASVTMKLYEPHTAEDPVIDDIGISRGLREQRADQSESVGFFSLVRPGESDGAGCRNHSEFPGDLPEPPASQGAAERIAAKRYSI